MGGKEEEKGKKRKVTISERMIFNQKSFQKQENGDMHDLIPWGTFLFSPSFLSFLSFLSVLSISFLFSFFPFFLFLFFPFLPLPFPSFPIPGKADHVGRHVPRGSSGDSSLVSDRRLGGAHGLAIYSHSQSPRWYLGSLRQDLWLGLGRIRFQRLVHYGPE